MGQKKYEIQLCWFLTLSSFSVVILLPAGQHISLLFPFIVFLLISVPSRTFSIKKQYIAICFSTAMVMCFALMKIKILSTPAYGVPIDCINSIAGRVVYDSSFTQSNNHLMTIFINEVGTVYGQTVSARGLINVIGNEQAIITSGINITLKGKFSNEFFKYSSLQVLSRSKINNIREFIIAELEKRMIGSNPTSAAVLSTMLIMGRADDYSQGIKELAKGCGCSHVLALSGMHLNSLGLIFKPIKNKTIRYILTVIVSSIFVFIAGPRPSLIRALLMLVFCFLPQTEKLIVSYIVQMILFPFSMINIGCVYSYLAIFAIVYIVPLVQQTIRASSLAASVSVLCLIAPIELINEGCWHPWAIIAGPIAGVLITVCMSVGFCLAIFGQNPIVTKVNNFVFNLLYSTLNFFSEKAQSGWKGFIVFASFTLLLVLALPIKKVILRQRFKKLRKNPIIEI